MSALKSFILAIAVWFALPMPTLAQTNQPKPRAGWKIELIASAPDVRHPSVVSAGPDGRIFVAEDPMDISSRNAQVQEGRILCLHPDGRRTVFADKLHAVFGMQYLEGKLYVLHNPKFTVFTDDDGIGRAPKNLIEQTLPEPWAGDWNDHIPANFRLGMDGFFYVAVGDKGLHGAVGTDGRRVDLNGGGVARIRPDGTGLEIISTGVRNILDIAMAADDEMFTYDNTDEHNWMGRVSHMIDGGEYGYPHNFVPQRPYTLWMLADYGAGAACGAFAWNNDSLPDGYRGNLVLADFGQRNIRRVSLTRRGGTFTPTHAEQIFVDPPADFRPVGISETIDGTGLFVCDWQSADTKAKVTVGRLWKLTLTNAQPVSLPAWWAMAAAGKRPEVTDASLIAGLAHPIKSVRLTAQRELARRGKSVRSSIEALTLDEKASPTVRWHALWALPDDDGSRKLIIGLAESPDLSVRRQALRWLGEHRVAEAHVACEKQLTHEDRSVRLQAAIALGRIASVESVASLFNATADDDLFARFASFTALTRIAQGTPSSWSAVAAGLSNENPRIREAVGFALRENFAVPLVQSLAALAADPSARTRTEAHRILAGLVHKEPAKWVWGVYHPALNPPPPRTNAWEGTALALSTLRHGVNDTAPEVREIACTAIGAARDVDSAASLRLRLIEDPSVPVRRAALGALTSMLDPQTSPILVAIITNKTTAPELWREAVKSSAGFPTDDIGAALLASLATNDKPATGGPLIEALGARKAEAAIPLLRTIAGKGDELREAAIGALGQIGSSNALVALRSLAAKPDVAVVRAFAATRQRDAVPDLVAAWSDAATRDAAIAGLLQLPDIRALDVYLDGLGSPKAALREKCRSTLTKLAPEIWPALQRRTTPLPPGSIAPLRSILAGLTEALASPILSSSLPAQTVLSADEYRTVALANTGDPWKGQQIFFDGRTACMNCHAVAGHGKSIGPDLTTIGAQFGPDALIESVLFPSKTIRDGYQQTVIELKNGEELTGAIRGESPENLILVDVEGRSQTVPKAQVKTRTSIPVSLMPEGLHAGLTREEFADLIAYVVSLKTDPRKPAPTSMPDGFTALFNGRDLTGWKPSPHWSAKDGILEHDGIGDHLWSTRALGDFELRMEWRWPGLPVFENHPIIDVAGHVVPGKTQRVLEAGDSGILFRGLFKAQANLFCYPVGSGEFWEYRESLTGEARRAVTPRLRADRPIGQWNETHLKVIGSRVTVIVNGHTVIESANLPGLPPSGPIGFQHEHGRIQIRNVWVRELNGQ